MSNFLYTLIIYPLKLIIEIAYQFVYVVFDNIGWSVIGVSIAVSLLCLPLYIVAENWQQIEREKQKRMEGGIARIKSTFKGDEQYMILTTFYRQNHYHPLMALRSSFGLLIQIPFFIAAYSFLSNLPALQDKSFWFIRDMSKPDAIFKLGNFSLNILPIAMTIINIAGSAVYTKGFKLKEKLPIYFMALVFLVLLYNSPAGLVLYWTMNNIFSLVKNIFYKIKRPLFVLYIIACVCTAAIIIYVLTNNNGLFSKRIVLVILLSIVFFIPLLLKGTNFLLNGILKPFVENSSERHLLFIISAVALALLAGAVIPSYAISSSVVEFMNIDNIANPNYYLANTLLQSIGLFVFWFFCVYFLFGKRVQTVIMLIAVAALFGCSLNAFVFGGNYGTLSQMLIFDRAVTDTLPIKLLNVAALLCVLALIIFLMKSFKPKTVLIPLCAIMLMSFSSISAINAIKIQREYKILSPKQIQESNEIKSIYHLSKTGKNVVVVMADRAMNSFVLPIFNAYPKLKNDYKDFTLYTHTISYDTHTLLAAPPLYGGYEYTPLEMNKRSDVPLKDKNNEALLLMARVFTEQAGFDAAQVSDLSWSNYSLIPDMSICDSYPKITGNNVERRYTSKWIGEHPECVTPDAASSSIKRNFLLFSFFKESPMFMRENIYDDANWWASDEEFEDIVYFLSYYSAIDYLPELTNFSGGKNGNFALIQTMITHTSTDLQAPDFVPVKKVTDKGKFNNFSNYDAISVNTAFFMRFSEWLDLLKQNDCYDNTRIIIVADHGMNEHRNFATFFNRDAPLGMDPASNNPLLMVKDFTDSNSQNEFQTNDSFMTNADVPYLAFKGIVENPVNPFTQKPILPRTEDAAYGISTNGPYDPGKSGPYAFNIKENLLYDVKGDISKYSNWKLHE